MSGFCYISRHQNSSELVAATREVTRRQFAASGFGPPISYDDQVGVLDFYAKIGYPAFDSILLPDGFAVVAGTFFFGGAVGAEALRRFAEAKDPDAALVDADGHFALILHRGNRTVLLRDRAGAFEVFLDDTLGVISTSFLALARTLRRVQMNIQEVYEYVFNGVSLGDTTPLAGVNRLRFGERIELDPVPLVVRMEHPSSPPICSGSAEVAAQSILQALLDHTAMMASVFDGRIKMALSGGYDSRLLLALFRNNDVSPELFVYGAADSADVLMAKRIATAEGLKLRHIEKSTLPGLTPDDVPTLVSAKFHREDGLPSGGVFDAESDLIQRTDRHAPGYLHVNGGGGEIFRNFFNLFDHGISLRDFVWLFYSQYDPAVCSADFDSTAYEDAICVKILDLLGTNSKHLDRRAVECLYPYFRCRSWFGRENSVNNRFGYSVVPFYERRIVDMALSVPISFKNFGNFEARMIRMADPMLAAHSSNYGHNFADDAPIWAQIATISTYLRPIAMRRYTYRIKRRLHRKGPRPAILTPAFLGRAVAANLPRMSRYFPGLQMCSHIHLNRIATLEYLFDQLQAD